MRFRLAVLVVSLLAFAGEASAAKFRKMAVDAIVPSQMELGDAQADKKLAQWKLAYFHAMWRADKKDSGMSLRSYIRKKVLKKINKAGVPTFVDPEGVTRNLDVHTRIEALRRAQRLTGAKFSLKTRLLKDYRGWSKKKYSKDLLVKWGKARFTPEVAALPPKQRIDFLPDDYDGMTNNPLRSAVGLLFDRLKLKKRVQLADYIEFELGDRLMADGLMRQLADQGVVKPGTRKLPKELALDEGVQRVLEARLSTPIARRVLKENAIGKTARKNLKRFFARLDDLP